jgi:arylsulfatase A-like enzyme
MLWKETPMRGERINIVFIVLDAVRAHNLSLYGYKKQTTPFLDSLSEKSVVYKNAISSSYWTLPSVASLFTGTYTSEHKLVLDGDKLSKNFKTLAEVFREKGYRTALFTYNPYVSKYTGLDRGFEYVLDERHVSGILSILIKGIKRGGAGRIGWRDKEPHLRRRLKWVYRSLMDKGASSINLAVLKWLKENGKVPYFIYVHYIDTHSEYIPPFSFRKKFPSLRGRKNLWKIDQNPYRYISGISQLKDEDFETLRALYDASILYLDRKIQELFNFFKIYGFYKNTLFIITSDHGDNIGEHGLMFHLFSLHDTLIKIPLVIKYPDSFEVKGVVEKPVQQLDLFPTLLDICGIGDESILKQISGNSLFSNKIKKRKMDWVLSELLKPFGPGTENYRTALEKYNRILLSIRSKEEKFIWSSDGNHEYYKISEDPRELHNLYSTLNDRKREELLSLVEPFRKRLEDAYNYIKGKEMELERKIEPEMEDRLRGLGYL